MFTHVASVATLRSEYSNDLRCISVSLFTHLSLYVFQTFHGQFLDNGPFLDRPFRDKSTQSRNNSLNLHDTGPFLILDKDYS